jgi:alkanesulfonate monooxygenase SsuD/methylene tetrahydromethanopterin reductase-like flavin-dependent oxidoreductase (luciferase family)
MRVGAMLPISDGDGPDGRAPTWPEILAIAQAIEDTGLDSGWLADHVIYRAGDGTEHGLHEAWTVLTAIAARTSRIGLGTLVLCAPFRNPAMTAKQAAAFELVAPGRLTLGVGSGWHQPEFDAFGLPFDHRVGRFEEWLAIVAPLVRGERVTFEGTYHRAADAVLLPPPDRAIPVLVASTRPRMLDLTARWADAWNTAWYGLADDRLRTRLADLESALQRAGRDPASLTRTVGLNVRDEGQPYADPSPNAIRGSVDDLARALDAHAALGFDLAMVGLEPISVRSVERLAEAVRLRTG